MNRHFVLMHCMIHACETLAYTPMDYESFQAIQNRLDEIQETAQLALIHDIHNGASDH